MKVMLSSLMVLVLSAGVLHAGERRLSLDEYRDKMKAAWIGQMVGVEWGRTTEFKFNNVIIPEDKVPAWKPELINGAYDNDDLYVEMTFLKTLEDHGLDASIRQAGIDFANSGYALWCANAAGRANLRKGIAPPDSSHPKFNKCPNDIDYQIEADYAGIISPGLPQEAIRLGNVFGRLMNYGDGVWAGQFVGALYAEAFFSKDVDAVLDAGLAAIPAGSEYAQMVRNVRAWQKEFPGDWTKAWEKIRATYSKKFNPAMKDTNGGIDVRLNGALIVLGLVYGGGDFDKSMVVSMRGGYDSDCNPSNVGGILMCMHGAKALDAKYVSGLDPRKKFSFTPYDFPKLLAVSEQLARQVVVRHGGRIEKDAAGAEWFVIPDAKPAPDPCVPSWKAPAPEGARYTEAEMKAQKFGFYLPDPEKLSDPDPTVRVQKSLDVIAPGWTTSKNAPDMNPGFRDCVQAIGGQVVGCVLTHPPKKGEAVTLSRTLKVPDGDPKLHFEVANAKGGDFRLVVKVDGEAVLTTIVGDLGAKDYYCQRFQPFDLSLNPWAGRTVKIELLNDPTDWRNEAATWHDIRITANSGAQVSTLPDPAVVSRRISEQFLTTEPDAYEPEGMTRHTYVYGGHKHIHYSVVSLWVNALECARLAKQQDLEKRLVDAYRPLLKEKSYVWHKVKHVDFEVTGAVPLEIAILTRDEAAARQGLFYADRQWEAPREDDNILKPTAGLDPKARRGWYEQGYSSETRLWIDDMYMIGLLQLQAYRCTGDRTYLDRAAREMALYLDRLPKREGLFFHAPTAPFIWARGNGWMAGAMPMILKEMRADDPLYAKIMREYKLMMASLLKHQRASGLWGQLVDDAESWDETSGSAMYAYAFAEGVKNGWLGDEYRTAMEKAYVALVDRLDEHANLADVCVGTGARDNREWYMKRTRVNGDPHGQAPLLWLCKALLDK